MGWFFAPYSVNNLSRRPADMHSFLLVQVLVFLSPLWKHTNCGIFKLTLQTQRVPLLHLGLMAFSSDIHGRVKCE